MWTKAVHLYFGVPKHPELLNADLNPFGRLTIYAVLHMDMGVLAQSLFLRQYEYETSHVDIILEFHKVVHCGNTV